MLDERCGKTMYLSIYCSVNFGSSLLDIHFIYANKKWAKLLRILIEKSNLNSKQRFI